MTNRPTDIELPAGWDWDHVEWARAKYSMREDMVPIAQGPNVVAWGTIGSVRTIGGKGYRMVTAGDYAPADKRNESLMLALERLRWKCREIEEHAQWIIGGMKPHEYIPF